MKIIKRDGTEKPFDIDKIVNAISKANSEILSTEERLTEDNITDIANTVKEICEKTTRSLNVEEIQDIVEEQIIHYDRYKVAKEYITYRYKRSLMRKSNSTDDSILNIVDLNNEEIKQENSNKNPVINSTQRDYISGEVSKDITMRKLLPKHIVKAHEKGIIHFHDSDYFLQHMHNCCLVNLEDMLQNGTCISDTLIETPHSFSVACNISTQIIAQIASNQYGGQSINLAHLAPFVNVSRSKIRKEVIKEREAIDKLISEDDIDTIVNLRLKEEIKRGVQTIQYQILTLLTTNGQTPFITIFMYLGELEDSQTKDDLAMIIEEVIDQRYQGVKNDKGVYITPAFPKLIYVLEEDNIHEDSKYYYLTEKAAKCTAKRMVPDYISEKKMKEIKEGNCFSSMGCVDGNEIITYKIGDQLFVEGFSRMWFRLSTLFKVMHQYEETNPNLYIDLQGVSIFDTVKNDFVDCKRIIRNISNKWCNVKFSNGRRLRCTTDHPFEIIDKGVVYAKDLKAGDSTYANYSQYSENKINMNDDVAWLLGFLLCDSSYTSTIIASIAANGEDDIEDKFKRIVKNYFGLNVETVLRERGSKGIYKDLKVKSDNMGSNQLFISYLNSCFGGNTKNNRQIPDIVFSWNLEAKLSFLAGMIDADGYIDSCPHCIDSKFIAPVVQIGSTNKELAYQQLALAQALGMKARVYENHYNSRSLSIRYRIEFEPTDILVSYLSCNKKKNKFFNIPINFERKSIYDSNTVSVISIEYLDYTNYSYDVTTESEHFEVSGLYSHNCRSFLAPWYDENGKVKFWGRFNMGVVTINLPDVACSSYGDYDKFWEIFEERLELCFEALMCRYERLKGTSSDVAPILWQYGSLARLEKGETIDKLLVDGYASISLGYAGLAECVHRMTGTSHTDPNATGFALDVMKYMNKKVKEWSERTNLGFSIYGTPIESTTYKFAKCLQNRFGKIEGVTDKNYITNSYHVHVTEEIDAFTKLKFESQFQDLSSGGAISYVEVPNMQDNIEAVLSVMKFIYENIMYAELNTKSDYCQVCGYDGEIQIVEDEDGKLIWKCPNCGNIDQNKMSVARRTCGYIGTQFWNQGRTAEIKERVLHL